MPMDVHPIPQNVTSFQFKLVGDMTLKQFIYLAAGCGVAYGIFVLFALRYPLFAWPGVVLSAGLGAAFAFLPIGSRPLDYWVKAFLKAVYSPTKRVWRKNGHSFKDYSLFASRAVVYSAALNQNSSGSLQAGELPASGTEPPEGQKLAVSESGISEPLPTQEELQKTVDLARQAQLLQMRIIQAERTISQIKDAAQKPSPVPIDYSQQIVKSLSELQNLVGQANTIKQQIQAIQEPEVQNHAAASAPKEKVKIIIQPKPKQKQIALTTFPNVINGIVKNHSGDYLEGVVAVIYDKEGLPVRALKTNKLGQFTGSTPLPNGVYTLEMEKDDYNFDVLQIELNGEVLPPLSITAKQ